MECYLANSEDMLRSVEYNCWAKLLNYMAPPGSTRHPTAELCKGRGIRLERMEPLGMLVYKEEMYFVAGRAGLEKNGSWEQCCLIV